MMNLDQYNSFADFVRAVARETCAGLGHVEETLTYRLGLLDVASVKTLYETSRMIGGITRSRTQQINAKIRKRLFSEEGRALFDPFVCEARAIFAKSDGILRKGALLNGIRIRHPAWTGATEFSLVNCLRLCGNEIEENGSGFLGWMSGTGLAAHYARLNDLLDDPQVPLEDLVSEKQGISEDEFRFLVHRVFETRRTTGQRWTLYLRLRCDVPSGKAARRRYAEACAIQAAGPQGLTCEELLEVCRKVDPNVRECILDADTTPIYDLDGLGTHLIHYDFSSGSAGQKRYTLDSFFRDPALVQSIKDAGSRLRRHMEMTCLGAVSITRLCREFSLPSACLFDLMRKYEAGGLKYYDHPNVAHPAILGPDGRPPARALAWCAYSAFKAQGRDAATHAELVRFCTEKLGMDMAKASSNIIPFVLGEKFTEDGKTLHRLQPPISCDAPPKVLLGCESR